MKGKRILYSCPKCETHIIKSIFKNELRSMWWCMDCHQAFILRFECEDVIDPHGRI